MLDRYLSTRRFTESLTESLEREDLVVQSMPDVSPTRWHLAHTSWFFETFVLPAFDEHHVPFHPAYEYLFNSYYNTVGDAFPRPRRGLLSRPTVDEVFEYRHHVDDRMRRLLSSEDDARLARMRPVVEIGIHHEQQHQELMLTDIKHVFSCNPLHPVFREGDDGVPGRAVPRPSAPCTAPEWIPFDEGIVWIGHEGDGFSFDNERPRHRRFVEAHRIASRLVTNGEYLRFVEDRGYGRPEFWLSAGWDHVQREGWCAPLYWVRGDGGWCEFTLSGLRPLDPAEPVAHVSYFEADAYARWANARLPTEAEWERAAEDLPIEGNLAETRRFHPCSLEDAGSCASRTPSPPPSPLPAPAQMFGDLWEWTSSPYAPYPGFEPPEGALGEYNGKFMCNQYVLRGGSCATPASHIRATYRNFFPPEVRWQFSGIRLAM